MKEKISKEKIEKLQLLLEILEKIRIEKEYKPHGCLKPSNPEVEIRRDYWRRRLK